MLVPDRWRGSGGTLKDDESESESAREAGVGRRIVKETLLAAADEKDMVVSGEDDLFVQVARTSHSRNRWRGNSADGHLGERAWLAEVAVFSISL